MKHAEGFLKLVNEAKSRIREVTVEETRERMAANDSARLIDVREDNEWTGYSYAWNDDQSDATLVTAAGDSKVFQVQADTGTTREQTWRYPSRTECMLCHSRASGFVLGLSTAQMNRAHAYGEVTDNQLLGFSGALSHHAGIVFFSQFGKIGTRL